MISNSIARIERVTKSMGLKRELLLLLFLLHSTNAEVLIECNPKSSVEKTEKEGYPILPNHCTILSNKLEESFIKIKLPNKEPVDIALSSCEYKFPMEETLPNLHISPNTYSYKDEVISSKEYVTFCSDFNCITLHVTSHRFQLFFIHPYVSPIHTCSSENTLLVSTDKKPVAVCISQANENEFENPLIFEIAPRNPKHTTDPLRPIHPLYFFSGEGSIRSRFFNIDVQYQGKNIGPPIEYVPLLTEFQSLIGYKNLLQNGAVYDFQIVDLNRFSIPSSVTFRTKNTIADPFPPEKDVTSLCMIDTGKHLLQVFKHAKEKDSAFLISDFELHKPRLSLSFDFKEKEDIAQFILQLDKPLRARFLKSTTDIITRKDPLLKTLSPLPTFNFIYATETQYNFVTDGVLNIRPRYYHQSPIITPNRSVITPVPPVPAKLEGDKAGRSDEFTERWVSINFEKLEEDYSTKFNFHRLAFSRYRNNFDKKKLLPNIWLSDDSPEEVSLSQEDEEKKDHDSQNSDVILWEAPEESDEEKTDTHLVLNGNGNPQPSAEDKGPIRLDHQGENKKRWQNPITSRPEILLSDIEELNEDESLSEEELKSIENDRISNRAVNKSAARIEVPSHIEEENSFLSVQKEEALHETKDWDASQISDEKSNASSMETSLHEELEDVLREGKKEENQDGETGVTSRSSVVKSGKSIKKGTSQKQLENTEGEAEKEGNYDEEEGATSQVSEEKNNASSVVTTLQNQPENIDSDEEKQDNQDQDEGVIMQSSEEKNNKPNEISVSQMDEKNKVIEGDQEDYQGENESGIMHILLEEDNEFGVKVTSQNEVNNAETDEVKEDYKGIDEGASLQSNIEKNKESSLEEILQSHRETQGNEEIQGGVDEKAWDMLHNYVEKGNEFSVKAASQIHVESAESDEDDEEVVDIVNEVLGNISERGVKETREENESLVDLNEEIKDIAQLRFDNNEKANQEQSSNSALISSHPDLSSAFRSTKPQEGTKGVTVNLKSTIFDNNVTLEVKHSSDALKEKQSGANQEESPTVDINKNSVNNFISTLQNEIDAAASQEGEKDDPGFEDLKTTDKKDQVTPTISEKENTLVKLLGFSNFEELDNARKYLKETPVHILTLYVTINGNKELYPDSEENPKGNTSLHTRLQEKLVRDLLNNPTPKALKEIRKLRKADTQTTAPSVPKPKEKIVKQQKDKEEQKKNNQNPTNPRGKNLKGKAGGNVKETKEKKGKELSPLVYLAGVAFVIIIIGVVIHVYAKGKKEKKEVLLGKDRTHKL